MTSNPLTTLVKLLAKETEKAADAGTPAKKDEPKAADERKSTDVSVDTNQCH